MLVSLGYDYVYKSDISKIITVALTWYNQGIVWREWPRFLYWWRAPIVWLL